MTGSSARYPEESMRVYTVRFLMPEQGLQELPPLEGTSMTTWGPPLQVPAGSHDEAARTVADTWKAPYPRSARGLLPGHGLAVIGDGVVRLYIVSRRGLAPIRPGG